MLRTVRTVLLVTIAGFALGCSVGARRAAGTGADAPIVVLVSIDGFRWDYLDRHPTPNLRRLAASGVRARWMQPSFPTQTFPNHYTIVTGLTPAHHGIVANTFVDPSDNARFRYSDSVAALQPRFWGGEPIWVTAERQGRRSAAFFWPGSDGEIAGVRPTHWKAYNGAVPNADRVDTVLSWLRLPAPARPAVVMLYFSEVDNAGHDFGPETPELAAAVARVDSMIGRLTTGIAAAGLTGSVNILITSDHGMAPTGPERVLYLDDYLDRATVNAVNLGQFISLIPLDRDTARVLRALARAPHLLVVSAAATPERWRYRGNPRISPVVGATESGWTLTTRGGRAVRPGGAHGHDVTDSLMRATFIAAGPAIRSGVIAEPFSNIHVYELMCAILGLRPAPNDGSLDSVRTLLR